MGFMAGAGPAFSNAFNQSREQSARRKEDLFKMTYSDFVSRRDKYDEYKREDAKTARKAEAILERAGGDPKTYPWVYKQVASGLDDEGIINDLRTGSFDIKDVAAAEAAGPEAAAPDPMAAQMEDSGMTPPTPPAPVAPTLATPPAAPAPVAPRGPAGGIMERLGIGGGRDEREALQAREKVAQVTGITPDEVQQTMRGGYEQQYPDASGITFKPGAPKGQFVPMAEAIFKRDQAAQIGNPVQFKIFDDMVKAHELADQMSEAAKGTGGGSLYIYTDPMTGEKTHTMARKTAEGLLDLNTGAMIPDDPTARPVTKEELAVWSEFTTDSKEIASYKEKQANVAMGYTLADEINQIVQANPHVLTIQGPITAGVTALARNVEGALDAIQRTGNSPESVKTAQNLEKQITEKLLSKDFRDAAEARELLDSKLKLAGYRFGKVEGQEGRDLTQFDVGRLTDVIARSTDPATFATNLSGYMGELREGLDQQGAQFNAYNPRIGALKSQYGYSPIQEVVPTFDDFWKTTSTSKAYENIKKFEKGGKSGEGASKGTPAPTVAPGTIKTGRGGLKYEFLGGANVKENWKRID